MSPQDALKAIVESAGPAGFAHDSAASVVATKLIEQGAAALAAAPQPDRVLETLIAEVFVLDEGGDDSLGHFYRCRVCEKGWTIGGPLRSLNMGPHHYPDCLVQAFMRRLAAAAPQPQIEYLNGMREARAIAMNSGASALTLRAVDRRMTEIIESQPDYVPSPSDPDPWVEDMKAAAAPPPQKDAREFDCPACGFGFTVPPLAAPSVPAATQERLVDWILKPLLVQLKWAVSHDPNPDKLTENIAEFAAEAERGMLAALALPAAERPAPDLEKALEAQIQMALRAMDMGGMTEGEKSFYEGKAAGVRQALNSVRLASASPVSATQEAKPPVPCGAIAAHCVYPHCLNSEHRFYDEVCADVQSSAPLPAERAEPPADVESEK